MTEKLFSSPLDHISVNDEKKEITPHNKKDNLANILMEQKIKEIRSLKDELANKDKSFSNYQEVTQQKNIVIS